MLHWFWRKIASRDDALRVIKYSSNVFFVLAAMQIGVAALIIASTSSARSYAALPADAAFNYLSTAIVIMLLASALRGFNSRTAAVAILLVYAAIAASTLAAAATKGVASGNLALAIIAIFMAIRATQATFKLHGRFAKKDYITEQPIRQEPPKAAPTADFVSHPKGGVESTAATAAMSRSPKPYDKVKWAALLKYDEEIAIVAARVRSLGDRWVDELAHAYLVLNDKQYLRKIEDKIFADAMAERARSRL